MIFGGTLIRVLDCLLRTVSYIEKPLIKKTENLQKDLDTLGEWVVENVMKINRVKSKAIRFTKARIKNPLGYSLLTKYSMKRAVINIWE